MLRASGRIVNITSVVASWQRHRPTTRPKAGIIGPPSRAKEFARRGVCVNAVARLQPSAMTDKLSRTYGKVRLKAYRWGVSAGRRTGGDGRVLCGDGASYITGQVFVVDGMVI